MWSAGWLTSQLSKLHTETFLRLASSGYAAIARLPRHRVMRVYGEWNMSPDLCRPNAGVAKKNATTVSRWKSATLLSHDVTRRRFTNRALLPSAYLIYRNPGGGWLQHPFVKIRVRRSAMTLRMPMTSHGSSPSPSPPLCFNAETKAFLFPRVKLR